jgi:hypothetical protein
MRCRWTLFPSVIIALSLLMGSTAPVPAQQPSGGEMTGQRAEQKDMRLVGYNDLQGRSAYQPIIQKQGDRWIAYIGHHGGEVLNPLTGKVEPNGTSIVDVTNPAQLQYLYHIPGGKGAGEAGGAQMVRACEGKDLPNGTPGKTYLLRPNGNLAHEIWDVTDPRNPTFVVTVVTGLNGTHKNWWECDTGIAYLVSDGRPFGWRTNRMTKIYDLSDPAHPRFIRDFGLPGQEPGSSGPVPGSVHGPIRLGNRVYFAYGTSADGILQIVDRDKLLRGDPNASNPLAPTPANLLYPQIGRLDMSPNWGAHTSLPILGLEISDFAKNLDGRMRDFVLLTSEATANNCQEFRHLTFIVDITTESKPFSVANFQVPESSGTFCDRGGRFGPHATSESFTPIYYKKIVFISYFNAGVRAVDVRDPYRPTEVAFYIPATTVKTDKRCARIGGVETCKAAIQTNNVEVDERGFIYIVDRANTGMHVLELTGAARAIIEK